LGSVLITAAEVLQVVCTGSCILCLIWGHILHNLQMEKFIRPPEAPIFYPTEEEFESPMKYIEKIKPVAEKFGICKIIPPPGWLPPFCLDPDKLEFKPRMQHLGMVDALTRLRAQWVKKLELFWTCKGSRKVSLVQSSKVKIHSLTKIRNILEMIQRVQVLLCIDNLYKTD